MLQNLPVGAIAPNPDQPRKLFDRAKLEELASSIHKNGLLQPIKVRPTKAGYEIVAGERRWRAHCILADQGKLPTGTIPALVERVDDRKRDIEAIIENLSRADITPMEEARAFKRLIDQGLTPDELAAQLGMMTWRIHDRLRLFNLSPEHIKLFESGQVSAEAVYEISRLTNAADQARVIRSINRGELTGYNAIRAAVATILEGISQADIFGESPKATKAELSTVARMEAKIGQIANMVAMGWKDGECQVARKVAPDRARVMADKLAAIQKHCRQMENELRKAAAQALLAV